MTSLDIAAWSETRPAIVAAGALPPPAAKVRMLMALRAIAATGQSAAIAAALGQTRPVEPGKISFTMSTS